MSSGHAKGVNAASQSERQQLLLDRLHLLPTLDANDDYR
jgi:hypothetical protein